MRISGRLAGLAMAAALGAVATGQAAAATNISFQAYDYSFQSWSAEGTPVANEVEPWLTDGYRNDTNMDIGFWTATTTFTASAGATITVTDLQADDAAVVELNGVPVASVGILGPGDGYFLFTPTGAAVPWTFLGEASVRPWSPLVITGLKAGVNTLEMIVDNTNAGILGQSLTGGPTSMFFSASVSDAVPEPATWALTMLGFCGLAALGRRAPGPTFGRALYRGRRPALC